MPSENPLLFSRLLLSALGTQMFLYHRDRIPAQGPVLMVSNHRSFLDAPLLMAAIQRPVRFACHHYMSQVPIMRDVVEQLGCFPLDAQEHRQHSFFRQASQLLQTGQVVGIFPEGAPPMVQETQPDKVGAFERGFAHLALRSSVPDLTILPVAIAAEQETCTRTIPLKVLSLFDPSEPLFNQGGWHPMILYQRVKVLIGRPYWLQAAEHQSYDGKEAKKIVRQLTYHCQTEIKDLLDRGYPT